MTEIDTYDRAIHGEDQSAPLTVSAKYDYNTFGLFVSV